MLRSIIGVSWDSLVEQRGEGEFLYVYKVTLEGLEYIRMDSYSDYKKHLLSEEGEFILGIYVGVFEGGRYDG